MPSEVSRFPFESVVIVADIIPDESITPIHLRRDLEQTSRETLEALRSAVEHLGLGVQHYEHPSLLAENAWRHRNDIVLSIFGGEVSRSRMALVPAVCESMGLSYIGPDAYGRVICQDKEVSKTLAVEAGLAVVPHRIVRSANDISKLLDFPLPYVVKPLLEGSSIGIGPENLVRDKDKGSTLVEELLTRFEQPIMVEAFASGREVSYCFIDSPERTDLRSLAESVWGDDVDHFDNHLFDSAHKARTDLVQVVRCINDELDHNLQKALERLLQFFGPMGYGRIDGKLRNGRFIFLEATPDAWLGARGTFVNSFQELGLGYDDVIAQVLLSGRLNHQGRSAND